MMGNGTRGQHLFDTGQGGPLPSSIGQPTLESAELSTNPWIFVIRTPWIIVSAHIRSARFSPGGQRIVTASRDRTARVWETSTGKELLTLAGHGASVNSAHFSLDGQRIVTASSDGMAGVWEVASGNSPAQLGSEAWMLAAARNHGSDVLSARFSPDRQLIVTVSTDDTARVWDAATGRSVSILDGHEGAVWSALFSRNGQEILTASVDTTARVWVVSPAQVRLILKGHESTVRSARFSRDGKRIVTASHDKTARVWSASTGEELLTLNGHEGMVWSARFSPDGRQIVTTSSDRTTRVWAAYSGKEVLTLRGPENLRPSSASVLDHASAHFSPDSRRVVTAFRETVRIWRIKNLLAIAKNKKPRDLTVAEREQYHLPLLNL